ncbi:MAG: four helix bundle protein [Bacteroidota bacterium]
MSFRFEQLKVFQQAAELSNKIDTLVEKFPKKEMFSLSSQVKRAADSVVLNIAEGSTGQTIPEFKRFLGIALRSGIEVAACLYLAFTRKYITEAEYRALYDEYEILCKMITKLRESI